MNESLAAMLALSPTSPLPLPVPIPVPVLIPVSAPAHAHAHASLPSVPISPARNAFNNEADSDDEIDVSGVVNVRVIGGVGREVIGGVEREVRQEIGGTGSRSGYETQMQSLHKGVKEDGRVAHHSPSTSRRSSAYELGFDEEYHIEYDQRGGGEVRGEVQGEGGRMSKSERRQSDIDGEWIDGEWES